MKVKYIIFKSIGLVYELRVSLAKALLIPFVFYVALDVFDAFNPPPLIAAGSAILSLVLQTLLAITTHRVILLGSDSVPKWGLLKWSNRETYFVLHFIGLGLILLPLGILLKFIPLAGSILVLLFYCWLFARLSLVFPAIAIEHGVSFKYAWKLTTNYQLLMFLIVVVYPIILSVPALALSLVPNMSFFVSVTLTLAMVYFVAALSVSYEFIYSEAFER